MSKEPTPDSGDDSGLVICAKTVRDQSKPKFVSQEALNTAIASFPAYDMGNHPRLLSHYEMEISPGSIRVSHHDPKAKMKRPDNWVPRKAVVRWSDKSRAKMVLRLATLDYSPFDIPGNRLAFITLTYPGDWKSVAPTAARAKNHLHRLRKRFERLVGRPFYAVWKMEFQRRGAPHFHLLAPIPSGMDFRNWLSHAWADVVDHPDPDQKANHLIAGTGVDKAKGISADNAQRISYYFSKHSSANKGVKEYQNEPPMEWILGGTVGRFWGYWCLRKATASIPISDDHAVMVSRTLRRWQRANSHIVKRKVWRTDTKTGRRYQRTVRRKYKVRSIGTRAFRLVPNGANMTERLAQSVS
jgi:hypothetical protein